MRIKPPPCKVGDVLHDELYGDVHVVGKKNGWPLCEEPPRPGPNPSESVPIFTGDLVKAVVEESIEDVCKQWGVAARQVRKWREAIAGRKTGVATALALKRLDPAFRKRFYTGDSVSQP